MTEIAETMKLLKFNLIFLPLLALVLVGVAMIARELLEANAREQILHIARLIMETASSSRVYTTKQVAPLLQHKNFKLQEAIAEFQKTIDELPKDVDLSIPKDVHYNSAKKAYVLGQQRLLDSQKQLIDSVKNKPEELLDTEFHPQSVPAFAATEISHYLNEKYPDYFYKEATLNPSNPRDRSTDWEADVVNKFRGDAKQTEFLGSRDTPTGLALFLARPLKVGNVSCLTCHSTEDKAPPEMVMQYPSQRLRLEARRHHRRADRHRAHVRARGGGRRGLGQAHHLAGGRLPRHRPRWKSRHGLAALAQLIAPPRSRR